MHGGAETFYVSTNNGYFVAYSLIKSTRHQIPFSCTSKRLRKAKARAVALIAFIGSSGGLLILGLLGDVMEQTKEGTSQKEYKEYCGLK